MNFNRDKFFSGYRAAFGSLNQKQVDGLNFLLDKLEEDDFSLPQASYVLATVDHETAHTFQPIKEIRERKTSPRRANQDRYWLDNFYGRGYVQITWRKNYEKFGIADNPDLALEPETAYTILSEGMKGGDFTGKKLSDYINDEETNFIDARKVVNGLDKADLIAGRARKFQNILQTSLMGEDEEPVRHHAARPKAETDKPAEPPSEPDKKDQVTTVDSTPPVVNVPTPKGSITSKVAAATAAVGPILGATGLKLGGIEFSAMSIIAICVLIGVGVITAAILFDRDRERQLKRQLASVNNLADRNRDNVVAGDVQS
jgi:predicted chitinase